MPAYKLLQVFIVLGAVRPVRAIIAQEALGAVFLRFSAHKSPHDHGQSERHT
jgi:hypothetical protein